MSELLEALLLGIVQGLTEFLPVSSSGHIEIAKVLLNDDSLAEQGMLVTVMLHFATALATMVVFRKDILDLIFKSLSANGATQRKYILYIIVSMVPAVFVGLFFEDLIEQLFNRNLLLIGLMLLITAVLLFFADKQRKLTGEISIGKATIIGIAQAIAIMPGISRSGATIASSILLGVERERAARFSFLMVIPLIFGKMAKEVLDGDFASNAPSMLYMIVGFSAAFIVGMLACIWMIEIVKRAQLKYFAYYCCIVAMAIFGVKFLG